MDTRTVGTAEAGAWGAGCLITKGCGDRVRVVGEIRPGGQAKWAEGTKTYSMGRLRLDPCRGAFGALRVESEA